MQVASAVSTLKADSPDSGEGAEDVPNSMNPMDYSSTHENEDDDVSDLGELVEDKNRTPTRQSDSELSESDDSDMAKQIEAAGEGESLIGSDDSSNESQLAHEEQYILQDASCRRRDDEVFAEDDFWDSLTPTALANESQDIIADELFKPQRGFASSPEPSFSDFFNSSDEMDAQQTMSNDDDSLTANESTEDYDDTSSTISDMGPLSVPLIAHVGSTNGLEDDELNTNSKDMPSDEAALKNAIPLLVIEDLDGRLIYARAGDGEAVFGSDGEFEFAGESDEESSEDGAMHENVNPAIPSHVFPKEGRLSDADNSGLDDGDTTDELPDDDMPYPRLLIGSIAPKGGRNARRAREIAARTRCSSRMASPAPSASSMPLGMTPKKPSSLSNVITIDDDQDEQEELSRPSPSEPNQIVSTTPQAKRPSTPKGADAEESKPVMGQFMPAFSKSVHRAVIDGSHRAPSPFNTLHSMQKDLRRKRSQTAAREGSFDQAMNSSSTWPKRKRMDSLSDYSQYMDASNVPQRRTVESSPESSSVHDSTMMDLSDVLDEGLIWQESGSSSSEDTSVTKNVPQRRTRSSSTGSHDRAFARWNRIPMGAFRTAQEKGASNSASPVSEAYMTHQRPSGTFLLTQSFPGRRKSYGSRSFSPSAVPKKQLTPFKSTISSMSHFQDPTSPLHLTLADPVFSAGTTQTNPAQNGPNLSSRKSARIGDHTVVGDSFLVSPVLRPVKHRGKSPLNAHTTSPLAGLNGMVPSDTSPNLELRARKVTKREKRERLARREALKRQQSDPVSNLPSSDKL